MPKSSDYRRNDWLSNIWEYARMLDERIRHLDERVRKIERDFQHGDLKSRMHFHPSTHKKHPLDED